MTHDVQIQRSEKLHCIEGVNDNDRHSLSSAPVFFLYFVATVVRVDIVRALGSGWPLMYFPSFCRVGRGI